LDTTDTDTVGTLTVVCYSAGALPCRFDFQVLDAVRYDEIYASTINVQEMASIT